MQYSKGDKVECIKTGGNPELRVGTQYLVTMVSRTENGLKLGGMPDIYYSTSMFKPKSSLIFAKDDTVKCVQQDPRKLLTVGQTYGVNQQCDDGDVLLYGLPTSYFHPAIFEKVFPKHFPHPSELHHYYVPKDTADNNGGSTDYYKLPPGAKDLQDLIEHRKMSFAHGNIFKAAYRIGAKEGHDNAYDLNKIIWFAQRMLNEINTKRT